MAQQAFSRPNATAYPIDELVAQILEGRVRVPDFQRKYRWQWDDVRRLMDSIERGYPIGSLLLWARRAQQETVRLGALTIEAPNHDEALWVVDGQQRLTSLASALTEGGVNDPRFAMSYDLARERFVKSSDGRDHVVPLPVVFDLQRLLRWFADRPESSEYLERATRLAKAIRQYSVPAYTVRQQDERVLRDIFDRMNNYGKRLTRAEVFSALHAGDGSTGSTRSFSDIVDRVEAELGFGSLDEDTVLRAVLARRGPNVTRDIRVEFSSDRVSREFPTETAANAHREGEAAIIRAIRFLREEAGVPHFGFLTYRYLLVVLARFFAHHANPSHRNITLLRRWFWRASIVGPERFGGWTQSMRSLAGHVRPDDESGSVQALLESLREYSLSTPNVRRFRSTFAASRVLLCAMWNRMPRSFTTGECYSVDDLSQSLEGQATAAGVVGSILRRDPEGSQALSANRILVMGDDTMEYVRGCITHPPQHLSAGRWEEVLYSHSLDREFTDQFNRREIRDFLDARATRLNTMVSDFLRRMTESDLEDTPPLDSLNMDDEEVEAVDAP